MDYEQLVKSVQEIASNEKVLKDGLQIRYAFNEVDHKKLDEHLFYVIGGGVGEFNYSDIIEVESDGLIVEIIKKFE